MGCVKSTEMVFFESSIHAFEMTCDPHMLNVLSEFPGPIIEGSQNFLSKSSQDALSLSLQTAEAVRIEHDTLPALEVVKKNTVVVSKKTKQKKKTKGNKNQVEKEGNTNKTKQECEVKKEKIEVKESTKRNKNKKE